MEAVALDWEKLGIKVKRAPEDFGNFLPKVRARKTGPTSWVYASPPFEEPVLAWQRAIWTKGAFSLVAERPEYDGLITTILAEINADKRATLMHDMAQKLYEQYHGVMLGMKSTTWALSKKVGNWSTLTHLCAAGEQLRVCRAGRVAYRSSSRRGVARTTQ
jgi:ABC-type transport system substrate-binding protein